MLTDITSFGAVGDGMADDTAALLAAAQSGKRVLFPSGTWTHGALLNLTNGTEFVGIGGRYSTVLKAADSGSYAQIQMDNIDSGGVRDMTLDGGEGRTSSSYGIIIRNGARRCEAQRNRFINQPAMGILVRDGADRSKLDENWFEPNIYGPHIYLLTAVTNTKIRGNHGVESAGFTISLHGGVKWTTMSENSCDGGYGELIGVTYDCQYGSIFNNHAKNTGDNGISVTGSHWSVFGNESEGNDIAGIGIYGSHNTVVGNICHNNNGTVPDAGGVRVHAAFGGLGSDNFLAGNVLVSEDGVTPLQSRAVRVDSLSYTTWAAGQVIGGSSTYRVYGGRLYMAVGSGITGQVPPVHIEGVVSDGAVGWRYVATSVDGFLPTRNHLGVNIMDGGVLNLAPNAGNVDLSLPAGFPVHTLATLPMPTRGRSAYVTDAPGGPVGAFANGHSWKDTAGQVLR